MPQFQYAHVVGARPNFMKAAPVFNALLRQGGSQFLIHTGQHYGRNMSGVFFEELELPEPDINLNVGSGSHACQTAEVMLRLEPLLTELRPDWLIVYGDVNSTMAAAITAAKLGIRIAHVEAGLRSFDRSMPEELNRIITDHLSELLFTPSPDGNANLAREGIPDARIRLSGNVMIDSLLRNLPQARAAADRMNLPPKFILATLHRPSNVDSPGKLAKLAEALACVAERLPVLFPVHPRTRSCLESSNAQLGRVVLLEPMGYHAFLGAQSRSSVVITDSGGVQEEAFFLRTPCLTLRSNTERPVTLSGGWNRLVGETPEALPKLVDDLLNNPPVSNEIPESWDGRAAERIAIALQERSE